MNQVISTSASNVLYVGEVYAVISDRISLRKMHYEKCRIVFLVDRNYNQPIETSSAMFVRFHNSTW